jgi:hypothetical protein
VQAACALLGSFARLLSPSECDKVVLSLIESQDDDALRPGVEALKMLPDAAEDGLGFLYFFTASAMEIVQVPSKSESRPPPIGKQELLDAEIHANSEAKWDKSRRGSDIVLKNNDTTVTRSKDEDWGGVLGSQLCTQGTHSFTYFMNKCETGYVWVGVAYDNVDLNDSYSERNIVLCSEEGIEEGIEGLRVFNTDQGPQSGYRTGDSIRIEVDMAAKLVTFYKNDVRLCQASGIKEPVRPFISIGGSDVLITIGSEGTALHSSVPSRIGAVSCRISAVANVISMLAAELNTEGRTSWWAPVSRWTRENIQPHDAKLAVLDRDRLKPVGAGGGSAQQGCTPGRLVMERRLVALEVLGGRIPTLDLRAQVDLRDGRMGVVVAQCKTDKAWVATHTSFVESDDTTLYLKSPYTGRLGPESLKLLLPWIVSMRDDLFASDVPSGSETNRSMILQLRMLRAVCEHSAAYDGYGADGNSGEFSTMGAREIAETLLEEKLLSPLTQLALNAGQYQSLRWAVAALEECVTELERVGGEVEDAARTVSASENSNPCSDWAVAGSPFSDANNGEACFEGVSYTASVSALLASGWTLHMQRPYSHATRLEELDPGQGTWMIVGAREAGSDQMILAATAKREDVLRRTCGKKETHLANGVYWYCSEGESFGFAGNADIELSRADTSSAGGDEHRLSWHIQGDGGGRAGSRKQLNSCQKHEKLIFVKTCVNKSVMTKIRLRLQGDAGVGGGFGASTAASTGGGEAVKSRSAPHPRIVQLQQDTVRCTTPSTSAGSTYMLAAAAASTSTAASTAGHGTPSASAAAPSASTPAGGAQHSIEPQLPAILDDMRKEGNAEKKDAEIKANHNSVVSQVSQVMSQAGKELKAAYALQIAIRCVPCLIATCAEASSGQSERILLLLEKVVLDTSYRVAVKRSVAKLFAQHRANPSTFMEICFKSLISPVVKAGASSNVATAPTTSLTVFVPKEHQSVTWRLGACFKGVTDIGVSLSDTKTDGSKSSLATSGSCRYSTAETAPFVLDAKLEETQVDGDRVWVQMAGQRNKERFVAKGASQVIVVESKHNYEDRADYCGAVCMEGAGALNITFDCLCHTESGCDILTFYSDAEMTRPIKQYHGDPGNSNWSNFSVQGSSISFAFKSDGSCNYWGWRFTVSVKCDASREDAETSQLSLESQSKLLLAQLVLACALDAKACVQYLAHPNHFKLICQLVVQQTGTRRVALLQILTRLIRLTELPQVFDLYFAPIMSKHALRLDVDKINIGREEGIGDLALAGTLYRLHVFTVCARTCWAYRAWWQGHFSSHVTHRPAIVGWCWGNTLTFTRACRVCNRMGNA